MELRALRTLKREAKSRICPNVFTLIYLIGMS